VRTGERLVVKRRITTGEGGWFVGAGLEPTHTLHSALPRDDF
jgi:hypothetical protein